ncbi:MAG: hypothetical protein H7338_04835 [Candidatus Sericytochromatia bacterium]|nr:hypothetical protein [Candidatus Sericytochromatia bacterium]
MRRIAWIGTFLVVTLAGCSTSNPMGATAGAGGFDTKLLNTFSIGEQLAQQVNYTPNSQGNSSIQNVFSNANALFPIASAVGTIAPVATNVTGQGIFNAIAQGQTQSQLVL